MSSAATEYDRMREHIELLNIEVERLRAALARVTGYDQDEIDALLEEYDRG